MEREKREKDRERERGSNIEERKRRVTIGKERC